jgi:hypothetical protein
LIAVPLSILSKSSGKIAEFNFERILRKKMQKLLSLSENRSFVLTGNLYKKTKNSGKVAEFLKKLK